MPPAAVRRKVFVSYKYKDPNVQALDGYTPTEDTHFLYTPRHYVDKIIDTIGSEHTYKGEKDGEDMGHLSDDTIDSKLKEKIFDSSVTIVLISPNMWNKTVPESEQWIPNEISYSLRDNKRRGDRTSTTNGMLAVALPDMSGSYTYAVFERDCGVTAWKIENFFIIIRENMFNKNDKNSTPCNSCWSPHHHGWDHSYIHPMKWGEFIANPNTYIDRAATLRERQTEFDLSKSHQ